MNKKLLALALPLVLNACTLPPDASQLDHNLSASHCCQAVKQISPIPLGLNQSQYAVIDATAPQLQLADLQGPAQLFSLPDSNQAYVLEVIALIEQLQGIAPQVSLYDSQFNLSRSIDFNAFSYLEAEYNLPDRLQANLVIQRPAANPERYILVHADPAALGETLTLVHPEERYAKKMNLVPKNHLPLVAKLGKTGVVKLSARAANSNALVNTLAAVSANTLPEHHAAAEVITQAPAASSEAQHTPSAAVVLPVKVSKTTADLYLDAIETAIEQGDVAKAAHLAEEAEKEGVLTAKDHLIKLLQQ